MAIEQLHPGVYVTELPFDAHPIDGVATSDASTAPAPEWAGHSAGDPGVTLLELMAFLSESLRFRAEAHASGHALPVGVASGLGVQPAADAPALHLSPGVALGPNGHAVGRGVADHRIDLAAVVSRYIGETEKNLGAAFEPGTPSRAVLLYDEAATLFGDRP